MSYVYICIYIYIRCKDITKCLISRHFLFGGLDFRRKKSELPDIPGMVLEVAQSTWKMLKQTSSSNGENVASISSLISTGSESMFLGMAQGYFDLITMILDP